jgi:hypothetical protein
LFDESLTFIGYIGGGICASSVSAALPTWTFTYKVVPRVCHVREDVAGGVKVTLLFVAYCRKVELIVVTCPLGNVSTTGMTVAVMVDWTRAILAGYERVTGPRYIEHVGTSHAIDVFSKGAIGIRTM